MAASRVPHALIVMTLVAVSLVGTAEAAQASSPGCTASAQLGGTFVQPSLIDGWNDVQLDTELGVLDDACIDTQILQWTLDSKAQTAIYDTGLTGYTQSTTTDVIDRLLSTAETWDKSVFVGLQINPDWFAKSASDPTWLSNETAVAIALADELYDWYGDYESFDGWYLPFEMDNLNFRTSTEWNRMSSFYSTIIDHLHSLSPELPVAISPFYNATLSGAQSPAQWQEMWESILTNSAIDIIALQDGVGAEHANVSDLPGWFSATKSAITNARPSTLLYADTETFNFGLSGLQPMPVNTFVTNMTAVAPYVDGYWAFAYDHYQSPLSAQSPFYHDTYLDYLDTGALETTPPGTPAMLSATATSSQTISLTWTPPSDNIGVAGYQISRNGDLIAVKQGASGSFVDSQLDGSTVYSYTVRAIDGAGNLSAASASASATSLVTPSYPNNWSSGRSYTSTVTANSSYPDTGGSALTDGVRGAVAYGTAWQGRNAVGPYSFTLDLGSIQSIGSVESSWLQVRGDYVFLPPAVQVSVSTDGVTFTSAGTIVIPPATSANQVKSYRLLGLSATGRYVRVTVDGGTAWTMLDEIEVRG